MKTTRQLQGLLDNNIKTKRSLQDKDIFELYDNPYGVNIITFTKILETFDLYIIQLLFNAEVIDLTGVGKLGILSTYRKKKIKHVDYMLSTEFGERIDTLHPIPALTVAKERWFNNINTFTGQVMSFRFGRVFREEVYKHVRSLPIGTFYPVLY